MDEMIVQAERRMDVDPNLELDLKAKLEQRLKARGLRTIVRMMEPNTLERTEFKAKRIIDKRDLYDHIMQKG